MQFNKLYNIIVESIISQNKEFRKNVLAKAGCHQDFIDHTLFRLKVYDNKTGDLLAKFIAKDKDWQWSFPPDPRLDKVAKILKLNPSIDIQKEDGTMDQFIAKYQKSLDNNDAKVAAKTISQLDKIPQFSQKKEYDKGVVIYRVQQSKAGMNAVRKIVDAQWGKKATPWCLITPPMEQAWDFWCQYSEYPKHIAFQNGKLLAFCANDDRLTRWWDRNDRSSAKLKLEDGTTISVRYKWNENQKLQKFIVHNGLTLNEKTHLYDSYKDVNVGQKDIIDGHFPVKLGIIKGDFECNYCANLISLEGAPKTVHGKLNISHCDAIKSLKGLEKTTVYGEFSCSCCENLQNLNYSPKVKGQFYASRCKNLTSLQGAPQKVEAFYCVDNDKLLTLKGAPKEVKGNFSCSECYGLTSLLGGPESVGGDYDCSDTGITTLQGAAVEVGGDFICTCTEITNLQGAPDYVGHDLICSNTDSLTSLDGAPKYIGRNLVAEWCQNLRLVTGIQNSEIKGHINTFGCSNVSTPRRLSIRYKLVDDPQQFFDQDNNYQDPDEEEQMEEEWDPQWENEEEEDE